MSGRRAALAAVLAAAAMASQISAQASARHTLRGIVFDSVAMRPLPGALVQLASLPVSGAPRSVVADSVGAFAFDSISLGSYLVGFTHAGIDSLGIEPHPIRVDLRQPDDVNIQLSTPSVATLVRASCKKDIRKDATGILHGYARSARDMMPVPHAIIDLEWSQVNLGRLKLGVRGVSAQANAAGSFLICGIPLGAEILARVFSGPDSTGLLQFTADTTGLERRDFLIGFSEPVHLTTETQLDSTDARPPVVEHSEAPVFRRATRDVRGVVRNVKGLGVYNARVGIVNGDSALTDSDGSFILRNVPVGSQSLDVRALGFLPATALVDVTAESDAGVSFQMVETPVELRSGVARLETSRISGKSLTASLAHIRKGFESRSKTGAGVYLDHADIVRMNPALPSELFRTMNGLTVSPGSGGNNVFMSAAGNVRTRSPVCQPLIFLDGARTEGAQIDALVIPTDLRAIEVYPRGELAPAQYRTLNGCGALVIWTKTMWGNAPDVPKR